MDVKWRKECGAIEDIGISFPVKNQLNTKRLERCAAEQQKEKERDDDSLLTLHRIMSTCFE